jgi:uncharacterized Rossmann fold enzyme
MRRPEWEPLYERILADMGYDRRDDESSARLLRTLTVNSDLVSDDDMASMIGPVVSVFGAADTLLNDIAKKVPAGTLISAGSATKTVMDAGIVPDIVVTDLDGDIDSQIAASEKGAVTVIHAHGDNADLLMRYVHSFPGRIMITTQSVPDKVIYNFGGFTDGDRAVCMARHFGARSIFLYGFDFDNPSAKDGSDIETKRKKLVWAREIIEGLRPSDEDLVRI